MILESLMIKIALIGVVGIGAQWIAWRSGISAIALMLIGGIIVGPVLGLINPEQDFGALSEPIIKLAVAVILFEGGLSLRFSDLRQAGGAVARLVIIGVPLGWALGTAAAYYGAGLSLELSALFGGILVVTGPTVIAPLLRPLQIAPRVKHMLKWEGIVNDPIGALLAVGIYIYITSDGAQASPPIIIINLLAASLVAAILGGAAGFGLTWAFPRGFVPDYLKAPILLVTVLAVFVLSDMIMHESGLISVTVMGVVMANRPIYSSQFLHRFKEDLTVILVSGVFIILAATLNWEVIRNFEIRFVLFLLLLLFVVRPLTILLALLFSNISWRERLFVAWIAPRGIVAAAITGLFALRLSDYGVADAEALVPLSFAVVIVTVFAHGFSASWFARYLKLDKGNADGVLLVGANDWMIGLAQFLDAQGLAVLISDRDKFALRRARQAEVRNHRGNIMQAIHDDRIDMGQFRYLVAATDNDSLNALLCQEVAHHIGGAHVYRLVAEDDSLLAHEHNGGQNGQIMTQQALAIETLIDRWQAGWRFSRTQITDKYPYNSYLERQESLGSTIIAVLRPEKKGGIGVLDFFSTSIRPTVAAGDSVIAFIPPEEIQKKQLSRATL